MDQIKDVVTVEEAVNRKSGGGGSDYVIIYGIMTSFDLDAENTDRFFRRRWLVHAVYVCFLNLDNMLLVVIHYGKAQFYHK